MTYPPQGPYGQQPPDPYQQGPYQQQPPWAGGPQGGFPMAPPPKRPRTGLIASLIIVAILVVGGGGVGLYFLLNKEKNNGPGGGGGTGDAGTAREAAETYVRELEKALNTELQEVDLTPLEPVACSEDYGKMSDELQDAKDYDRTASASPGPQEEIQLRMEDFKETSDGATFTMTERESGDDDSDDRNMTVAKEGGDWKVCGIYEDGGGETPPTGEDGPSQAPSGEVPPNPFPPSGAPTS
jgi:hypothetical protein